MREKTESEEGKIKLQSREEEKKASLRIVTVGNGTERSTVLRAFIIRVYVRRKKTDWNRGFMPSSTSVILPRDFPLTPQYEYIFNTWTKLDDPQIMQIEIFHYNKWQKWCGKKDFSV